ncbi:MAG: hypothetical protein NVS4B7_14760 [Ktedonobacteraceae bacterium]
MFAYVFLEKERQHVQAQWQRHVTIGEVRRDIEVTIKAMFSIGFISSSNLASNQTPCINCLPFEAFQPKSARIEYIDFAQFTWQKVRAD